MFLQGIVYISFLFYVASKSRSAHLASGGKTYINIYIYCTNLQHTGRRDKPRRLSDLLRFSSARARWETSDFAGETA